MTALDIMCLVGIGLVLGAQGAYWCETPSGVSGRAFRWTVSLLVLIVGAVGWLVNLS